MMDFIKGIQEGLEEDKFRDLFHMKLSKLPVWASFVLINLAIQLDWNYRLVLDYFEKGAYQRLLDVEEKYK